MSIIQQSHNHQSLKENIEDSFISKILGINFEELSFENDKKIIEVSTALLKASKTQGNAPLPRHSKTESSKKMFTERFIEKMSSSELNAFHQRIWKVWTETTIDSTEDPEFGRHFLEAHIESPIVIKAIEEECRYRSTSAVLKHLSQDQIEEAKVTYSFLAVKDQHAIEGKIWKLWTKKNKSKTNDPEFGKHYLCKFFEEKKSDTLIIEAFDAYLKEGPLDSHPQIGGFFYKIKDSEGKTRGYALGSIHISPASFLKFRQKIQKSFDKSNAYLPEILVTHYFSHSDRARLLSQIYGKKMGVMDLKLEEKAKAMGKKLIPLENWMEHFQVVNEMDRFSRKYPGVLNEPDLQQNWQKGNLKELNLNYSRYTQSILNAQKQEGSALLQHLVTDRNIKQSSQMDNHLNDKSLRPFFLVGCNHFCDNETTGEGVIKGLEKKGWICIPH